MISKSEVKHVANLARITFLKEDIEKMQKELAKILDYIEKLKEVDIKGVRPTTHSINLKNVLREDIASKEEIGLVENLINLAPQKEGKYIKIKSVF
jgi:aspartyl-tRNA(Asn)/glutamyl-tRNA(Gln) amidotransferase subunit C